MRRPFTVFLLGAAACAPGARGEAPTPESPEVSAPAPVVPAATVAAAEPEEPPRLAPDVPIKVRITGDEWRWIVRYSGLDGALDTDDDVVDHRNLRLAAGSDVTIDLASNDYIYTFYVPQLDIMEVAAPTAPYELELETGPAGVHDLLGSQMCGFTHPELLGDVIVQERSEFADWLSEQGG